MCVTEFLQDAALTDITLTSSSVAATAVPLGGTCTTGDLCDVGLHCVDLLGSTNSTCETALVDEAGGRAPPKAVTLPMNESFVLFGGSDADCYSFDLAGGHVLCVYEYSGYTTCSNTVTGQVN